jgi:long-chain acyl-CoA synthetase
MVSGEGHSQPYAIVVLAEHIRPRVADAATRADVEQGLRELREAVNNALPDYAQLHMIVVSPEPWTIEAGTLTPTMKIRRSAIEQSVAPQVARWYAAGAPVVWA